MIKRIFVFALLAIAFLLITACGSVSDTIQTSTPTPTVTITTTTTLTATIQPTSTLGVGSAWISPKDGMAMLYIPAGEFEMGSDSLSDIEKPVHTVYLNSYWMDQTEITNAMYAKCVAENKCNHPSSVESYTHDVYYGNPDFNDYPMLHVSWYDAQSYCNWRGDGTRLPTEAEWEKAASWDDNKKEQRIYPWGNAINCARANYWGQDGGCVGDTTRVGSYPSGKSFYGLLDMAGNVWEWTDDWWNPYPGNIMIGDSFGTKFRVVRGGAWGIINPTTRSAHRWPADPSQTARELGFRCSRSAE